MNKVDIVHPILDRTISVAPSTARVLMMSGWEFAYEQEASQPELELYKSGEEDATDLE